MILYRLKPDGQIALVTEGNKGTEVSVQRR